MDEVSYRCARGCVWDVDGKAGLLVKEENGRSDLVKQDTK